MLNHRHAKLLVPFFMLFISENLLANNDMRANCPTIANFSISATDQNFDDCTYFSAIIPGASTDPSLCLKAFDESVSDTSKISCKYSNKNNGCVCTINGDKY